MVAAEVEKVNPDTANDDESKIHSGVKKLIEKLQGSVQKSAQKNWGMYDVADKAFDAMQSTIGRQKIAAYPPDIEIIIARNACGTLEFERAAEMIELGYQKAQQFANDLLR